LAYRLNREDRIDRWVERHPQYRDAVAEWVREIKELPLKPSLHPIAVDDAGGLPGRHTYLYFRDGIPMPLAIHYLLPYPDIEGDDDDIGWVGLILYPEDPDETI